MVRKAIILTFICALLLTTGCLHEQNKEPIVISINYPSENLFYKMYGYDFENKYPHITVKVIEHDFTDTTLDPDSDIIFFDRLQIYQQYIEDGKLLSLDQKIRESKYPISEMPQVITHSLRSNIDHAYYGLSPSFISYALFFNKDLFESFGVPMPTNQMTWEEIFELASLFPNYTNDKDRLYGFKSDYYTSIAIAMVLEIGKTEGLRFIDPNSFEISFDSTEWKDIFHQVVKAFRSGAIYDKEDSMTGNVEPSPILAGQAAMEIQPYSMVHNFEAYSKHQGGTTINWGLVTAPVSSKSRDESIYYDIQEIYAISSKTQKHEAAWQLIEFITSDKQNMKSNVERQFTSGLPANINLIQDHYTQDLTPLYMLKPANQSHNPYDYIHHDIINAFKEVGEVIIRDAIDEKITEDEALEKLETEGQNAVNLAREKLKNRD
ncbi:ABC transporter substrate-binding protein [Paenibacillus marinisediminis]